MQDPFLGKDLGGTPGFDAPPLIWAPVSGVQVAPPGGTEGVLLVFWSDEKPQF